MILSCCSLKKNILKQVSESEDPRLSEIFQQAEKYELQIIYSRIQRKNGRVEFKDFKFRVDAEAYFYPASTVKLPVAVLSLEKLKELKEDNLQMDRTTPYYIGSDTLAHSIL